MILLLYNLFFLILQFSDSLGRAIIDQTTFLAKNIQDYPKFLRSGSAWKDLEVTGAKSIPRTPGGKTLRKWEFLICIPQIPSRAGIPSPH